MGKTEKKKIDELLKKVIPWRNYIKEVKYNLQDIKKANALLDEAKEYIQFYDWCENILEIYVGMIYSEIIAIFLFKIKTSREDVDEWIWVVVGDIPPTYLTIDICPNPGSALDGYIGAMEEWVEAASNNISVKNLIPVNVPATKKNAELLRNRLEFLDNNILIEFMDDLN